MTVPFQIILHGGANQLVNEAELRDRQCQSILAKLVAYAESAQVSALDICEYAVRALEDDIAFNAGTGSYLQMDGNVRMDASLMDSDLRLGAVMQIEKIRNPISVARALLEKPMHCTLAGGGANRFAAELGAEVSELKIEKQEKTYTTLLSEIEGNLSYKSLLVAKRMPPESKLGTVGCVVRDKRSGLMAAGTSTGGLKVCYPGRVGDSGMVGAGNYANEYAAISCTGIGEKIMRISLARLVSFYVEEGLSLKAACDKAMAKLELIEGQAGLIAISHKGELAYAYNTKTMSFAIHDG
ncbi:MAG: isoaspartyl peptidase/L-asparaginase [Candidatus Peregrinibacteria bacterium]|nr:isoaspartyl peptidase/L-asparaginase [Candidatus Peregrinibacteria bacterium]